MFLVRSVLIIFFFICFFISYNSIAQSFELDQLQQMLRPKFKAVFIFLPSIKNKTNKFNYSSNAQSFLFTVPLKTKLGADVSLDLSSLKERRTRGDLIQVFKIFYNFEKVELCKMPIFNSNLTSRGHSKRYFRELCKYTPRQNFLTNRIANEWNILPQDVVDSKSVNEFKEKLDKFMNELN